MCVQPFAKSRARLTAAERSRLHTAVHARVTATRRTRHQLRGSACTSQAVVYDGVTLQLGAPVTFVVM